jgi:hypothetical protein
MLRLWLIIVATISLAAVSLAVQAHEMNMAGQAHEISMAGMLEHDAMTLHMEHASSSMGACSEGKSCNTDSGLCAFVCAGISAWLAFERTSVKQDSQQKYSPAPDAVFVTAPPGRNHRPPISRLL